MSSPETALRFVAGGTVQAANGMYVERRADTELLRLCRDGAFAYVLTSRQMGKSSLMIRTAEQLIKEGIRPVIVDLTELGAGITAVQWYRGILQKIAEQLDLSDSLTQWWESNREQSLAQKFNGYLTGVVLRQISQRVVVFVDEIDTTLRLDFSDDFFASIRYLYNARATNADAARLSFVLLGVASPIDLMKDAERTPFNIGERVDLEDFTEEEVVRDLRLDRALVQTILRYTKGHPYLTLRVFKSIAEKPLDSSIETRVTHLFFGEQATKDSNLQFVRDMITKHSPKPEVLLRYRDIRRGRSVLDHESDPVCVWLRLSGIVRSENGSLRVRNKIYETVFDDNWVRNNRDIDWRKVVARAGAALVALLILIAAILAPFAYVQRNRAVEALAIAERNAIEATKQAQQAAEVTAIVNRRLRIAQDTLKLKRAIFFGETKEFGAAISDNLDSTIRFRATRQEHPYRSKTGRPTYTFRMLPVEASILGGFKNVALVTYKMDHSSFPNSLIAAGPDRQFEGSYDGVGCLSLVTALVEYIDPDRMPSVGQFNQCTLIEAELGNSSH